MTTLTVDAPTTALVLAGQASTQLVAALDPPAVLTVAPAAAALSVTLLRAGVLVAPADQGPAGPPGPAGGPGPAGVPGGNRTYAFDFVLQPVWAIPHGLGRFPSVTTLETSGDQIVGDLRYLDANTLQVTFTVPVSGTAYLN